MSSDPLERWSAQVADGEAIDWDAARSALDDSQFRRLRQLAELAGTLRRTEPPDPAPRRRWGHLEIRGSLGRGSFGDVLLAFDSILKREVALKLMRTDVPGVDPERWIEEAQQLARIRHPNVLAVHGADRRDGIPGLWADRIQGRTLREAVASDRPEFMTLLNQARQLASAVAAVHAAGLVHGDIKPGNVMIDDDGRVVLMDFGTAAPHGEARAREGSPAVMSPERLAGGPPSRADDLHALGAVFAFLSTGRYPYPIDTLDALRDAHATRRAPELPGSETPRAWRALLRDMLDADPGGRPTIEHVLERIDRLQSAPLRRRRTAALASIFSLLLIGLVMAVVAYVRVSDAESETSAVNALMRDVLAAPRSTELGRDVRVVDVLKNAIPEAERRFSERPRALARVRALVGTTLESLGEFEQAEVELRRALATQNQLLGAEDARNYLLLDSIARIERQTGRVEAAEATWDRLIHLADGSTPAGREALIHAYTGRARLRMDAAAPDAALAELDRAMVQHIDAANDRAAQKARMLRGLVLVQAGRLEEARVVATASLEESLRLNGPRHSNTIVARDRLLQVHHGLGELEQAEALARENLDVAEGWLGTVDRLTVMTQLSLSNMLADRGKLDESLVLLDQASVGAREVFGPEESDALVIDANRAARMIELGRYGPAAELAADLARRLDTTAAPVGGLPFVNGLNLAEARYWMQDHEGAQRQAEDVRNRLIEAYGENHPLVWIAESYMGAALIPQGRHEDADEWLEAAHERLASVMGPDHAQVLLTEAWRIENRVRAGRPDAVADFMGLLDRAETLLGPDHYRLRDFRRIAESFPTED